MLVSHEKYAWVCTLFGVSLSHRAECVALKDLKNLRSFANVKVLHSWSDKCFVVSLVVQSEMFVSGCTCK